MCWRCHRVSVGRVHCLPPARHVRCLLVLGPGLDLEAEPQSAQAEVVLGGVLHGARLHARCARPGARCATETVCGELPRRGEPSTVPRCRPVVQCLTRSRDRGPITAPPATTQWAHCGHTDPGLRRQTSAAQEPVTCWAEVATDCYQLSPCPQCPHCPPVSPALCVHHCHHHHHTG